MKLFLVSIPESFEDTDWYVAANTFEDAVRLYVDSATQEDEVSVDQQELFEAGSVIVKLYSDNFHGEAGVIDWEAAQDISHAVRIIEQIDYRLDTHADWGRWRTHCDEQGFSSAVAQPR